MREELQRTALLLDELSLQKIQSSKVAVFGIGGVGSYALCGMELRRNEKITFRCTELEKDALAEQAAR